MVKKEGLLIVFEGIDGSGTSTQLPRLTAHIKRLDKYQDVLETHEPWDSAEIKRKLAQDSDAYSDGLQLARLFIGDRTEHTHLLIRPNIRAGAIVNDDRYSLSTCAYQSTQGVPIEELIAMHKNRGILIPDLTLVLDVTLETAKERMQKRGDSLEKFERDPEFIDRLIKTYRALSYMANASPGLFGDVRLIDGNRSIEEVAADVIAAFNPLYEDWKSGKYQKRIPRD